MFYLKKPQKLPKIDYERYYSEIRLKQTPTLRKQFFFTFWVKYISHPGFNESWLWQTYLASPKQFVITRV